jgi:hypothetical protein
VSTATTIRLELPRPHPGQWRVKEMATRFNVLALGRRWGKTTLGEDVLLTPALKGYPVAWFAPTYKLLAEPWRDFKRVLTPVTKDRSEQEHRIELVTGGVVECWTLDGPDPARGRKYKRVGIDEGGIVRDLMARWNEAIRPTLTDLAGDAWFFGTPKGRNGFWQLHQRGVSGDPEWSAFSGPTSQNPHISAEEIEAARRDLPDRVFRQEFLAEFLDDGGGVFRHVAEAAIHAPEDRQDGHYYVAGVDWAREYDYTVISVIDATTKRQVALDRFSQVDYALQTKRLLALREKYGLTSILAEANAMGGPLIEALQRLGVPIQPWTATNQTKAAIVDGLALALERGQIGLLNDEAQTGELLAFAAERLPSGLIRYAAPEGMHDDTVIALALAWEAATVARPRVDPKPYSVGASAPRSPLTDAEKRLLAVRKQIDALGKR